MRTLLLLGCIAAGAIAQPWQPPESPVVFRAMERELERGLRQLAAENAPAPYYIEYRLQYRSALVVQAVLGTVTRSVAEPSLRLTVGMRVGSPELDNTNMAQVGFLLFGAAEGREPWQGRPIPLELDELTLRRELWLATDAAYKEAVEAYARKLNLVRTRIRRDTTPDFRLLPPDTLLDTLPVPTVARHAIEQLCRELSAIFRDYPHFTASAVGFEYLPAQTWYCNSEGRRAVKTELFTGLEVVAYAQGRDGTPLAQYYSVYVRTPQELPSRDSLIRAVRLLAQRLESQRNAPALEEPYVGPVLFEGRAAGELFAQAFVPNVVAVREPMSEFLPVGGRMRGLQQRLGTRVLPPFLSVWATPCRRTFEGTPLVGSFCVDDEGMAAESVAVVVGGVARGLLTTRVPVRWVQTPGGHNRAGAPMPGVLEIASDTALPAAQLRERFLELLRERGLSYGLVVRSVANINIVQTILARTTLGAYPPFVREGTLALLELYRVYPDGREELLQPCDAVGVVLRSLRDIVAVSQRRIAYNYLAPAAAPGSEMPYLPVSLVVPDVLLEELEVRPREGDVPKLPVVPPPFVQEGR